MFMPSPPITSNATLRALTERLASHSRSLQPLIGSSFASSFSPQAVAAAASAHRQPAPPPQLPVVQLAGKHQDVPQSHEAQNQEDGVVNGEGSRCPVGNEWPEVGVHEEKRCSRCEDEELEGFVRDMGSVLRREFDCWVEQCWLIFSSLTVS